MVFMAWIWNQFTRTKKDIYKIENHGGILEIWLFNNDLDHRYEVIVYNTIMQKNPYYDYGIKVYIKERYYKCFTFWKSFLKNVDDHFKKTSRFIIFDRFILKEKWVSYEELKEELEIFEDVLNGKKFL